MKASISQQAAEKAIKAIFVQRGVVFPFSHDLARLLGLLEACGIKVPKYVRQCRDLTPFAAESRYPGLVGPVTKREYRRAVRIAERVFTWARRQIDRA